MQMGSAGIYIHVPFCVSKCAYCDFYSLRYTRETVDAYVKKTVSEINRWGEALQSPADTLYFGGGTPSLLSAEQMIAIIDACKQQFSLKNAEITLEANPAERLDSLFETIAPQGVNRVSLGLQSAVKEELSALSRRHTAEDLAKAVAAAKAAGIMNLSLDIMLGIPGQTKESLKRTVDFALAQNPTHISAYLLTLEPGTPLYNRRESLPIPDSDAAAELYLYACDLLGQAGFERYEISNFAKNGCVSRHNIKYWTGENYLGIGPAAHSFWNGLRFHYDRDLEGFLSAPRVTQDGTGGGIEETVMLRLRLKSGLSLEGLAAAYPALVSQDTAARLRRKIGLFVKAGLADFDGDILSLTDRGALLSNQIISELLCCL